MSPPSIFLEHTFPEASVHDLASALKLYLRRAEPPVLEPSHRFKEAVSGEQIDISTLRSAVNHLAETNHEILRVLLAFFQELVKNQKKTLMDATNVGIAVGGSLMAMKADDFSASQCNSLVVTALISHFCEIFENAPCLQELLRR